MKAYSYIVSRDYGFAPNPFGKHCTLATCKPVIRKNASVGDFIFGLTSKSQGNKLIYALKITEKVSFNEYWNNQIYSYKKPVLNGSLITKFGDNIYYFDDYNKCWNQADSHHSYENGVTNFHNLNRDTKTNAVLISEDFYYFGKSAICLSQEMLSFLKVQRGCRLVSEDNINIIWEYLTSNFNKGITDFPELFKKGFRRHDGVLS